MPNKNTEKLEHFRRKFRASGLNMTPQRTAIYEILIESPDHPRAEDIYERIRPAFPDIAIDTVYRTLSTFSDLGLIHVVEGYGEAKRYDPEVASHHHFRCRRCSRIIDFQDASYDHLEVPAEISMKHSVTGVKVIVEGLCDTCLSKQK
jgi:Fe2+ or Zn2+ uptake regulation protein